MFNIRMGIVMELKEINGSEVKKNEKGATMVEYAMMVALVAAVCIVAVTNIGKASNAAFTGVATQLNSANN